MAFDTRQALSIQATRTIDVGRGNGGLVGDWLVHSGIARYSNFSLEAIYPRPDTETNTFAYHRKKHSQVNYRLPVGVRGGSVPYRFELVQGPSGMTIGQEMDRAIDADTGKVVHTPGENYGVINWDDSNATGTHTVQVRVTDQLGATLNLTWTVECDDTAFVFCNSTTGNDANAGTFAAPLQTFHTGLWKNSDADATYVNKIAMFTGTFDIYAETVDTSPALTMTNKPVSYIGVNGCIFNTSRGHFRTSGNITDLTEIGIDFVGSRTDLANNRIHNFTNRVLRHTQSECSFDNITAGTITDSNPACNFYADSLSHQYLYYHNNELKAGCQVQLYSMFEVQHKLDEGSIGLVLDMPSSNGSHGLHWKDDVSFAEIRFATLKGSASALLQLSQQNSSWPGAVSAIDQEVRFNTLVYTSDGMNVLQALFQNSQSNSGSNGRNLFIFRNTIISSRRAYTIRSSLVEGQTFPVNVFDDLYVDGPDSTSSGLASGEIPLGGFAPVALSAADFNENGELIGSARGTYLGLAGAEIAGEAA